MILGVINPILCVVVPFPNQDPELSMENIYALFESFIFFGALLLLTLSPSPGSLLSQFS